MHIFFVGSRITTIFNFGYVSLNIMHLRVEDTGLYTLRAVNRWGEAVCQSTVRVIGMNKILLFTYCNFNYTY